MSAILRVTLNRFRNLKLKQKLFFSYMILILLPLSVYTYFSYVQISNLVKSQTEISANQIFSEAASSITNKIRGLVNTLDFISVDSSINEVVVQTGNDYDINEQLRDYYKLQDLLNNFERNNDLLRVRLYFDNSAVYTLDKLHMFSMDEVKHASWYQDLFDSTSTTVWFKPAQNEARADQKETRLISAARFIWNLKGLTQRAGISRVDITEKSLQTILAKAKISEHSLVYLQNQNGEIMAISDSDNDVSPIIDEQRLADIPNQDWEILNIHNQDLMVKHQQIEKTDWNLVTVIPLREVFSPINEKRNQLFLVMFIIATLSYFLAYYISSFSTNRINQLLRGMRKVQAGDLDALITTYNKDEIGDLVENFNNMLQKITLLNQEQFQSGKALKQAELKTLQAQINPHFLYNSLDVINCVAINHNLPIISSMVVALTNFYKLGLNKGKEIVTIRDEIEHISLYVDIQNIRFENSIQLIVELSDELYSYQILKITLQPLVENAILHGLFENPEQSGTIKITGQLESDYLMLYITDNGVGIPQEIIDQLLDPQDSEDKHGFGIKNIQERIVLTYGEGFGLSISSTLGEGTTVSIKFPKVLPNKLLADNENDPIG
jgi:two-component system sensor histidine kinase YesM